MNEPILKSCGTVWTCPGPRVAHIELTDGTKRETTDRVDMALVHERLRLRCAIMYALRHLEQWCECEDREQCDRRVREILRETEEPDRPFEEKYPNAARKP